MKTYLTLDIGGSAIKHGLIQEDLTFLTKSSTPTPLDTLEHFTKVIKELYNQYQHQIDGIAISMPGVLNPKTGYVQHGGALQYIKDINIVNTLREYCPIPITIHNDAKCAALAEVGYGSLKDVDDAIAIILGTGVGGCLIHNKEVIMGKHFYAGEFSFVKTNTNDSKNQTEYWCFKNGITGLLTRVQKVLDTKENYTGYQIFEMANQGHEKILEALDEFTSNLATQIYNLQMMFDPEKIVIGGGISAQPILLEYIQSNIDKLIANISIPVPKPQVIACHFKNDANLIGALYHHLELTQQ